MLLQQTLDLRVKKKYCSGIAASTLSDDIVTFFQSGHLAYDKEVAVTEDTLFEIGSITKVFTNLLLACYVLENSIDLKKPVTYYLPDLKLNDFEGTQIRVIDLATHTAALPKSGSNIIIRDPSNPFGEYSYEAFKTFVTDYKLPYEPGTHLSYSNIGMALLGHLISKVGGKPYISLLREKVLNPLKMEQTGFKLKSGIRNVATGHVDSNPVKPWVLSNFYLPTGGLLSNAKDMTTFLRAFTFFDETPLKKAFELMQQVHFKIPSSEEAIGLGVGIYDGYYSHEGGTGGFSSVFIAKPKGIDQKAQASLILSNSTFSVFDLAAHALMPSFELSTLHDEREVDHADWPQYEGNYKHHALCEIRGEADIILEEGQLYLKNYRAKIPLHPLSDNTFFTKERYGLFEFNIENHKVIMTYTNPDDDSFQIENQRPLDTHLKARTC